MTTTEPDHGRAAAPEAVKILVGLHGYEPEGYESDVRRALAWWPNAWCRIVLVVDANVSPFTSLLPAARVLYQAAAAEHLRREQARVEHLAAGALAALPNVLEIERVIRDRQDPARIITDEALSWAADLLVVAAPEPSRLAWLWPGAIHERVVHRASCAVLVVSSSGATAARRSQRPPASRRGLLFGHRISATHRAR